MKQIQRTVEVEKLNESSIRTADGGVDLSRIPLDDTEVATKVKIVLLSPRFALVHFTKEASPTMRGEVTVGIFPIPPCPSTQAHLAMASISVRRDRQG